MPRVRAGMADRMGALSAEHRLHILFALRRLRRASAAELAAAVGISRNRLWPHLSRLIAAGLVISHGEGRDMEFSVNAGGLRDALADIQGLADERWPVGVDVPGPLEGEEGT